VAGRAGFRLFFTLTGRNMVKYGDIAVNNGLTSRVPGRDAAG
jgi:hypothetical protein